MSKIQNALLLTACVSTLSLAFVAPARSGEFAEKHPRRAQVLRRERSEVKKNEAAEESGKITEKQENKLNREDRAIRRQEQAEAAANGGHITKGEQRQLNREENRVNRERRRDEKRDAAAASGTPSSATPPAPVSPGTAGN